MPCVSRVSHASSFSPLSLGIGRGSVKKGIDADQSRRRRDDTRIQIRKNKREEGLQKRRAMAAATTVQPTVDLASNKIIPSTNAQAPKTYNADDIPRLLGQVLFAGGCTLAKEIAQIHA